MRKPVRCSVQSQAARRKSLDRKNAARSIDLEPVCHSIRLYGSSKGQPVATQPSSSFRVAP
jgi:hypothetical protein